MDPEVVIAVVLVGAPFWAISVFSVAKMVLEGFQSADTQQITERTSGSVPQK